MLTIPTFPTEEKGGFLEKNPKKSREENDV